MATTYECINNISAEDSDLIDQITARAAERYEEITGEKLDFISMSIDLTVAHMNNFEIDLEQLLTADNGDFGHDVFGIMRHMNRETGKLENCFVPRFAKRQHG